jgi:TolB-like protein
MFVHQFSGIVPVAVDGLDDNLKAALADRYEIVREIGRGGMATVYLARDLGEDRDVAIKVLNSDLSVAMGAERFRREVALAASLDHPNILRTYEAGESNGVLFCVMPYVAGESLAARLTRERQLAIGEAVRIACDVASALEYAHSRGFVHRDIKPENILLEDGRVLVADFGIARAISGPVEQKLTQTGVSIGTPTYMSPEQALAERTLDGRSDVYSLACVLYEMLAGQPPFIGPTAQAIVARQMLDAVPSLTIVRSAIPDELEDAVLRALAKTPADRYSTAAEFAEALRAAEASGGATLGRAERRTRPRNRSGARRNPARSRALAGLAAVTVLAIAGLGAFLATRPDGDAPSAGGLPPERIAVLYFVDGSSGGEFGYVADGLTEALIDELKQVRNLDIVSANGVAQFRATDIPADSIARSLGAGTLVEGSLEPASGNRLRVQVRLIDGNSGADLGSRASFEQGRGNLFGIRDTLTSRVAALIRERVGTEVRLRQQRAGTRNAAAWSLARQADTRWRRDAVAARDSGDVQAMDRHFAVADSLLAEAERLDPSWPDPVIQRGFLAARRVSYTTDRLAKAALTELGLQHAERALAIDPRSVGALELRGTLRYQRYNAQVAADPAEAGQLLRNAEEDLRAAVAAEPSRATAWYLLSHLSYMKLDIVEAKLAARRAYEEDAYLAAAPAIVWTLFNASYLLEQFSDAVQWCDVGGRRFSQDHRFIQCQLMLLASRAREPDVGLAWRLVRELEPLTPQATWELARRRAQMYTAVVLARANLADSARRVIAVSRGTPELDSESELIRLEAFARVTLGEKEEALRLLRQYVSNNQAREQGGNFEYWWWRDLRDDPRYRALAGT